MDEEWFGWLGPWWPKRIREQIWPKFHDIRITVEGKPGKISVRKLTRPGFEPGSAGWEAKTMGNLMDKYFLTRPSLRKPFSTDNFLLNWIWLKLTQSHNYSVSKMSINSWCRGLLYSPFFRCRPILQMLNIWSMNDLFFLKHWLSSVIWVWK